ncbi:flavodoxin [Candidatus Sumerlaeota bacterium]|nr:flavodoxin [Candidatus Sumerlaeota bacterium]
MSRLGLFFGSSSGNTEAAAELIRERLGGELEVFMNVADAYPEDMDQCDALIFGVSTWEDGQLQDDWDIFFPDFEEIDLTGKTVALFGLGDAKGYSGMFVDAMRILYNKVIERGATVVGSWPTEGYDFTESEAVIDGRFVGLALDRDNQDELTGKRIDQWLAEVMPLLRK